MNGRTKATLLASLMSALLYGCGGGDATQDQQPQDQSLQAVADRAFIESADTTKAPGELFDLSGFSLQLPTGSPNNPDTVSGSDLKTFKDSPYFYTNSSDNSMVMADPKQGYTTNGSQHPRVELRETSTWKTSGTNHLTAEVKVVKVPDHTTIGQIFQGSGPSKPLCELQVTSSGEVELLLEDSNEGSSGHEHPITSISIGSKFNYQLELSDKTITVIVAGVPKQFSLPSSFVGESFYFKAGDYDQSATEGKPLSTVDTVVQFYELKIEH